MPRRLGFLNLGGFATPIEIDGRDLDAAIAMLGTLDPERVQDARLQIEALLEDFSTARTQTVKAKTIQEDLKDLESLAKLTNPEWMTERLRQSTEAIENLKQSNPVLHQRLQWLIRHNRIQEQGRTLERHLEEIFEIGWDLARHIEALKNDVALEDGRGRPSDDSAFKLANGLYQVWVDFTGKGTARQNASDRPKFPFGDFVVAVGRLIEPEFDGHHVARKVHDDHRGQLRGGK